MAMVYQRPEQALHHTKPKIRAYIVLPSVSEHENAYDMHAKHVIQTEYSSKL